MIVIVDYGLGNLGSIRNMFRKIGFEAQIGADRDAIGAASKIILPGVGAFDTGMNRLHESGLVDVLTERALGDQIPVLGICLGAQLMTRRSDEGVEPGLGWFAADTVRMEFDGLEGRWPLPNIGWRDVEAHGNCPLLAGYGEKPRFYFVHSYCMRPDSDDILASTSTYGHEFACGLMRGNLHAAQFHPEKSHSFGMRFLRNFANLD